MYILGPHFFICLLHISQCGVVSRLHSRASPGAEHLVGVAFFEVGPRDLHLF